MFIPIGIIMIALWIVSLLCFIVKNRDKTEVNSITNKKEV